MKTHSQSMLNYLRVWCVVKIKQLYNTFGKSHRSYTKFIVLCEGRTGSTLLHTYLNFNRQIYSYGEIDVNKYGDTTYLAKLFKPFSLLTKSVGFKLFYEYEHSPIFKAIIHDQKIKIIHLYRQDVLGLYTSFKIAENTGNWSYNKNETIGEKKIRLDWKETQGFINNYFNKRQQFLDCFSNHDSISVSYEQLTENPQQVLRKIQHFLEVKPKKLISILKKQNPEPLTELILNYDEIIKKLVINQNAK